MRWGWLKDGVGSEAGSDRKRGSILIEGVLGLSLAVPAIVLALELVRASWWHALLHVACQDYTRSRFLGLSEHQARQRLLSLLARVETRPRSVLASLNTDVEYAPGIFRGRVQKRYESLLPALQTRFQITKRCQYSYSE